MGGEDRTGARHGGDEAVGDAAALQAPDQVGDHVVPDRVGRGLVDALVGDAAALQAPDQVGDHVADVYARDAGAFAEGGETTLEILHSDSTGDLAYWTGLQHAKARLTGHDEPVEMHLRITELFRHEDGAWRLIHRHADPLVKAPVPAD